MGVDADIRFKLKEGATLETLELPGWVEASASQWEPNEYSVDNGWRYYGDCYHRGYWPEIAAVLLHLLRDPNVEELSYKTDLGYEVGAGASPFTFDEWVRLSKMYLDYGQDY